MFRCLALSSGREGSMSVPVGDFTSEGGTRRMICTPKMEVQELAQVVAYLLRSFGAEVQEVERPFLY